MKKMLCLLLALALLGLAACAKAGPEPTPTPEPTATPEPTPEPERVLVVYFSRSGEMPEVGEIEKGNTAVLAEKIAGRLNGDLFELRPADDRYSTVLEELSEQALTEQEERARPPIADRLPDLSEYDVIFIGAPVWHGDWPMILYTYFEGADLANRRLIPFCTHNGTGIAPLEQSLKRSCPYSQVEKGLGIRGVDVQNDPDRVERTLDRWFTVLGFPTA